MTTTEPTRRPRGAVALLAVGGLAVVAAVAWWIVSMNRPPQLGTDAEAFQAVDALFTAITARDDKLLEQCARRLQALQGRGKLPDEAAGRPKRGFTLPFDTWMRGGLRETSIRGIESAVALGWVNARAAAAVWGDWQRGRAHWSRAWGLSVLGQFLQEAA